MEQIKLLKVKRSKNKRFLNKLSHIIEELMFLGDYIDSLGMISGTDDFHKCFNEISSAIEHLENAADIMEGYKDEKVA